jgi:hypothetical protein
LSAPYLAGDERGEAATDEEAAGDEAARVGDKHDADDEWTGDEEHERETLARAHDIAYCAHDQTRHNGACD